MKLQSICDYCEREVPSEDIREFGNDQVCRECVEKFQLKRNFSYEDVEELERRGVTFADIRCGCEDYPCCGH
jgi:hypothetical protein